MGSVLCLATCLCPIGPCPAGSFTDPKPHGGMNGELRPQMPEPLCKGVFFKSEIDNQEAWKVRISVWVLKADCLVPPVTDCGTWISSFPPKEKSSFENF